jgi:hypothetical protein
LCIAHRRVFIYSTCCSTKLRADHCASRFQFLDPATGAPINIDTHHPYVPPVFVIQIQIPSDPPSGFFSSAEDGPGWAILMYYKITEVQCLHSGLLLCALRLPSAVVVRCVCPAGSCFPRLIVQQNYDAGAHTRVVAILWIFLLCY